MSHSYEKILTEGVSLTRFYSGGYKLQITGPYIGYHINNYVQYSYVQVLELKQTLIEFLRVNKNFNSSGYFLNETLILNKNQVKTLITDLHLYLKDEVFTK